LCIIFVSCSGDDEIIDNSQEIQPGVKIVNNSHLASSKISNWVNYGVSKMKNQNSDILMVTWNVGNFISEGGFDRPYNKHEVLLSNSQIESMLSQISTWLDRSCLNNSEKSGELNSYRNYLENGADASSQIVLCSNSRIILAAFQEPVFDEEEENIQSFLLHELYHAFQHDIGSSCDSTRENNSSSNGKEIVEGAAEYFGKIVTGQINGTDGVNKLLEQIYMDYQSSKDKSIDSGNNWAAGVRLMIERNILNESIVLDGSLFHNCETETNYTDSNLEMGKIKTLWYLIEKNDDQYSFSAQALND
jgi:hypothetical protein